MYDNDVTQMQGDEREWEDFQWGKIAIKPQGLLKKEFGHWRYTEDRFT